jgi:hypothetical protein
MSNVKTFISRITLKNNSIIPSPPVGEGGGEGETHPVHPHLDPPPSRGRIIVGNFAICH